MRWADMDLLGHVNNVTYLDYLAEARLHVFPGLAAGRAVVASHRVAFMAPLVFHRQPVLVDTWVSATGAEEVTLEQEVYDESEAGRTVYLRASTRLAHRLDAIEDKIAASVRGRAHEWGPVAHRPSPTRHSCPVKVRLSDTGEGGLASDTVHFEYFQEARIQYLMDLHPRSEAWSHHVVARTDVHFEAPVALREAPYAVHSWIGHLGTRSFTIQAELRDGDRVLASSSVVMVTFDMDTQRSTEMASSQRARLEAELG